MRTSAIEVKRTAPSVARLADPSGSNEWLRAVGAWRYGLTMLQHDPHRGAEHAHAPTIHTAPNARHTLAPILERAFGMLGAHGNRKRLMALLDNRITRGAVLHWRKGRHPAPAWALDRVATELETASAERAHVASLLRAELEKRNAKP